MNKARFSKGKIAWQKWGAEYKHQIKVSWEYLISAGHKIILVEGVARVGISSSFATFFTNDGKFDPDIPADNVFSRIKLRLIKKMQIDH